MGTQLSPNAVKCSQSEGKQAKAVSYTHLVVGLVDQVELAERRHRRLPVDHRRVSSKTVKPLCGDRLKDLPHGRIAGQNVGEMLHGQREQVAVSLRAHACHPLSVRQQTYLYGHTVHEPRTVQQNETATEYQLVKWLYDLTRVSKHGGVNMAEMLGDGGADSEGLVGIEVHPPTGMGLGKGYRPETRPLGPLPRNKMNFSLEITCFGVF